jgi:hypothetical protein
MATLRIMTTEKQQELLALSKPLIEWLNKNTDPHHHILIDPVSVELVGGVCAFYTKEFVKD